MFPSRRPTRPLPQTVCRIAYRKGPHCRECPTSAEGKKMGVNRFELEHAIQYAANLATERQYYKFKKSHPHLFEHARIDIRPADFYIPPTLADVCKVVRVHFNEKGCRKIGCFPYKQNLDPCQLQDETRWVRMGSDWTLACQPACSTVGFDTEMRDGQCILANTSKKLFALFPEQALGMKSKRGAGLDVRAGRLLLNEQYCRAYGLDFERGECTSSVGQQIGEVILGSTVIRSMTAKSGQRADENDPPDPVPEDVATLDTWKKSRQVRSQAPPPTTTQNVNVSLELAKEIAFELSVDLGIDLGLDVVTHILKKRVPGLLTKMAHRVIAPAIIKSVMVRAVARTYLSAALTTSKAIGSAVSVASIALAVYSIVALVIDIVDPFEFNRVLDQNTLDVLSQRFDIQFFKSERNHVREVTPDAVWNELESDMSDEYEFMVDKVTEYLAALRPAAITASPLGTDWMQEKRNEKRDLNLAMRWNRVFHTTAIVSFLVLAALCLKHVHILCIIVFVMIAYMETKTWRRI